MDKNWNDKGDTMTKKTVLCENKDFKIIKIESMTSMCCGKVPFSSICINKKRSLQQLNLDGEQFESLRDLLIKECSEPKTTESPKWL